MTNEAKAWTICGVWTVSVLTYVILATMQRIPEFWYLDAICVVTFPITFGTIANALVYTLYRAPKREVMPEIVTMPDNVYKFDDFKKRGINKIR